MANIVENTSISCWVIDLNFLLMSFFISSKESKISEASDICLFIGLATEESSTSLVTTPGWLVRVFEGFVVTNGGISGAKCVCRTVCLSVFLSVETPSFPLYLSEIRVFHPPISC
jgi:hypothetical protein